MSQTPYLLDRNRDLGLIIAAPLWVAPMIFLAASGTSDVLVNSIILAVGGMGHHLPGMLRAYGDRALFERFRAWLIVAPIGCSASRCCSR